MYIEESIEYLKNYKYDNEVRQAIETLLTAYEKEKEKNKKIENKMNELVDDYENQLLEKNNYIFNLENEREALWNKLDEEFD